MKYKFIINFIVFFYCSELLATGPSYINAEINPISVNANGDILCRTRYDKNILGSHTLMPVEYGLVVISNRNILEYVTYTAPIEDDGVYDKLEDIILQHDLYEQQFFECELKNISKTEQNLRKKYNFTECNVDIYKQDINLSPADFEKKYNLNLNNKLVFGLKKGRGVYLDKKTITEKEKINVLYDVEGILIINITTIDDNYNSAIWDFNYKAGSKTVELEDGKSKLLEYDFDMQKITGIMFVN